MKKHDMDHEKAGDCCWLSFEVTEFQDCRFISIIQTKSIGPYSVTNAEIKYPILRILRKSEY